MFQKLILRYPSLKKFVKVIIALKVIKIVFVVGFLLTGALKAGTDDNEHGITKHTEEAKGLYPSSTTISNTPLPL